MNRGFTTTFILVVVMAFVLAGSLSIASRTISVVRYDRVVEDRAQAIMSANACAEVALQVIRSGSTSGGSVNDSPISCTYAITDDGGGSYTVYATSTVDSISRTVEVSVSNNNPVTISSWEGVRW